MKHEGVSEVVGALILVSIGVLAMGIVILVLVSGSLPGSVPSFSGLISNSSRTIYISHEGGDPLWRGQYRILVDGVDRTASFVGPDPFSLGKNLTYVAPTMPGRVVMVFNTSGGGGTILLSADLTKMQVQRPDWFDCSWNSRKRITITTGASGVSSGYSASLTLNHALLVSLGRSLANGNDIRVVRQDGTELPRALDPLSSWNSPTTTIWFPLGNAIPASSSDTGYYLYYGNAGASLPPADWANIFRMGDDFNGGTLTSGLTVSVANTSTITETGGEAVVNGGGSDADAALLVGTAALPADRKFVIRNKVKTTGGSTTVCCNPETKTIGIVESAALATVIGSGTENPRRRIIVFHRANNFQSFIMYMDTSDTMQHWNGAAWQSGSTSWGSPSLNTYYIYTLISDGTSWYIRVSDASGTTLTTTTAITWASVKNGGSPFWFYTGEVYTDAYWVSSRSDWMYLRDYVSPEPSTSLGSEEPGGC